MTDIVQLVELDTRDDDILQVLHKSSLIVLLTQTRVYMLKEFLLSAVVKLPRYALHRIRRGVLVCNTLVILTYPSALYCIPLNGTSNTQCIPVPHITEDLSCISLDANGDVVVGASSGEVYSFDTHTLKLSLLHKGSGDQLLTRLIGGGSGHLGWWGISESSSVLTGLFTGEAWCQFALPDAGPELLSIPGVALCPCLSKGEVSLLALEQAVFKRRMLSCPGKVTKLWILNESQCIAGWVQQQRSLILWSFTELLNPRVCLLPPSIDTLMEVSDYCRGSSVLFVTNDARALIYLIH